MIGTPWKKIVDYLCTVVVRGLQLQEGHKNESQKRQLHQQHLEIIFKGTRICDEERNTLPKFGELTVALVQR